MSIKVYNEPIPVSKMSQFDEILKASGGRYLNKPRNRRDCILVNYEYSPEKGFAQRWNKATQDIMEVRKDQWWRIMSRRVLSLFGRAK